MMMMLWLVPLISGLCVLACYPLLTPAPTYSPCPLSPQIDPSTPTPPRPMQATRIAGRSCPRTATICRRQRSGGGRSSRSPRARLPRSRTVRGWVGHDAIVVVGGGWCASVLVCVRMFVRVARGAVARTFDSTQPRLTTTRHHTIAGMGEHRLRDLNDQINKLLREKFHWQRRIKVGGLGLWRVGVWLNVSRPD